MKCFNGKCGKCKYFAAYEGGHYCKKAGNLMSFPIDDDDVLEVPVQSVERNDKCHVSVHTVNGVELITLDADDLGNEGFDLYIKLLKWYFATNPQERPKRDKRMWTMKETDWQQVLQVVAGDDKEKQAHAGAAMLHYCENRRPVVIDGRYTLTINMTFKLKRSFDELKDVTPQDVDTITVDYLGDFAKLMGGEK